VPPEPPLPPVPALELLLAPADPELLELIMVELLLAPPPVPDAELLPPAPWVSSPLHADKQSTVALASAGAKVRRAFISTCLSVPLAGIQQNVGRPQVPGRRL
jgi:hypothetical protein